MGNSPELGHRAIWRTAEATAADCLTCSTNQSSQFHALVALLHSRAFSTHKALLPCTLLCALTAALPCLLPHSRARRAPALSCLQHAQGCLALYALLRFYSCTHVPAARTKLSCLVRSLAPSAALTCPLHAQALLPCALPCALSCTHVPAARTGSLALCAPLRLLVDSRAGAGDDGNQPRAPAASKHCSSCSVTRLAGLITYLNLQPQPDPSAP
jgi:hypothetical protein